MLFSEDGTTLLGCGNDGLHVVGWEPARVLDTVHGHWGHIHDITVAQTQLVSFDFIFHCNFFPFSFESLAVIVNIPTYI